MHISAKKLGLLIIGIFTIGILASAYGPSIRNQVTQAQNGGVIWFPTFNQGSNGTIQAPVIAGAPGIAVQGAWNIPSINPSVFPYNYQAIQGSTQYLFLPAIPVLKNFTTLSSRISFEFNQLEAVLADLVQHTSVLGSTDLAHRQLAVTNTIQPLLTAYTPGDMTKAIWAAQVGPPVNGLPASGNLKVLGQTFTNFQDFLGAVVSSNAFAQQLSLIYGWGWTEICPSGGSCSQGQLLFVPAGRYWNPTDVALVIQSYSDRGMNENQIVNALRLGGYSDGLITAGFIKAESFGNSPLLGADRQPGGTAQVVGGSANPWSDGSYTLGPGIPEGTYIVDQTGQIWGITGLTTFTGVKPQDQNDWIAKGCAGATSTSSACGLLESFWAKVGTNGGWGAVRGGNVPTLTVSKDYIIGLGQRIISSGVQFTNTQGGTRVDPSNPYQTGINALVTDSTLAAVIYSGYGVTTFRGGTHFILGTDGHFFNCDAGCLSPAAWDDFIKSLRITQQYNQEWASSHGGSPLLIGQPTIQQGLLPGFGVGAALPTVQDAMYNAYFNGVVGYSADQFDQLWNPNAKGSLCTSDAVCIGQFQNNMLTAYGDINNPSSITAWYFGSPKYPSADCGNGCGWVNTPPSILLDPGCAKDQLCAGPNTYTSGPGQVTHYLMSNDYKFMINSIKQGGLGLDPVLAKQLMNKEIGIGNDIMSGKLTARDQFAVESMINLVLMGSVYYGVDLKDYGTPPLSPQSDTGTVNPNSIRSVFSLPFKSTIKVGDFLSGPVYDSSGKCISQCNFQDWYTYQQTLPLNQKSPLFYDLSNIYIGKISVGQLLSDDWWGGGYTGSLNSLYGPCNAGDICKYTGGAYKLVSAGLLSVVDTCTANKNCDSWSTIEFYLAGYMHTQDCGGTPCTGDPQYGPVVQALANQGLDYRNVGTGLPGTITCVGMAFVPLSFCELLPSGIEQFTGSFIPNKYALNLTSGGVIITWPWILLLIIGVFFLFLRNRKIGW